MQQNKYVIIRTEKAGVHAGTLVSKDKNEVVLENARRLYYWDGAATLSELAMKGVKRPGNCKFPMEVSRITLLGVIEILETTPEARNSIATVPIWAA